MRFIEWDYDLMEVAEYKRTGECARCGECCRHHVVYYRVVSPRGGNMRSGGATTDGIGRWIEVNCGRWSYFFKITKIDIDHKHECSGLIDGLCIRHEEKDNICAFWPMEPRHLFVGNCSYAFQEMWRSTIDELAIEDIK